MYPVFHLYRLSQSERLNRLPGFWRVRDLMKRVYRQRYLKMPYLEGSVWACPNHAMGIDVFKSGLYEPVVIELIRSLIGAGFSFMDVGANIGLHTLAAAFMRISPDQSFHAFEPEPTMFSMLAKNCRLNHLAFVQRHQEALGSSNDFLPLFVATDKNQGRHSLRPRDRTTRGPVVKVTRIDTLSESDRCSPDRPLLVKIDVEGYEREVLQGGKEFFARAADLAILCEIELNTSGNNTGRSIPDLMAEIGVTRSYTINDCDTFAEDGRLKSNALNMIFLKGSLAEDNASPFLSSGALLPPKVEEFG